MKNSPTIDKPGLFSGACTMCCEVYEASSQTDDLEGVTFRCRKVRCAGQVTLKPQAKQAKEKLQQKTITRIC